VPSLRSVAVVGKQRKAQSQRREGEEVACTKTRMRMRESIGQIPSPFIHSHGVQKKHRAQSTPTLTRGSRAHQSASMGQPIGNPRRQGASQMLHIVRGSHIDSGTMAMIASTPPMHAAP
jgi:hypothetical protein